MAHRTMKDSAGRVWEVWETHPDQTRPSLGELSAHTGDTVKVPITVPDELTKGWLVFLGQTERRRFAPIPEGWALMTDSQLQGILDRATPVTGTRRVR